VRRVTICEALRGAPARCSIGAGVGRSSPDAPQRAAGGRVPRRRVLSSSAGDGDAAAGAIAHSKSRTALSHYNINFNGQTVFAPAALVAAVPRGSQMHRAHVCSINRVANGVEYQRARKQGSSKQRARQDRENKGNENRGKTTQGHGHRTVLGNQIWTPRQNPLLAILWRLAAPLIRQNPRSPPARIEQERPKCRTGMTTAGAWA